MQFQVPQFIELEDKIVGPLTFKQFLFIVGGGGAAFIFYQLPLWGSVKFFLVIFSLGIGGAFAFYRLNNKSLLATLEDAVMFYVGQKLYLWKKVDKKIPQKTYTLPSEQSEPSVNLGLPVLSQSKLRDLTWGLDVQTKKKDL
ncbi:MAG: PrgI family protein [Minisyncoccia bacterium]